VSTGSLSEIFRALDDADVRYLVVGGVAVVFHGHPRFTADLDLVLDLTPKNASSAIATLQRLGYRPRAPVPAEDFAKDEARARWREEKGLTVFSLWSPSHPGTEVDLFVEEPFDFEQAWSRRLDAVLDDGTTVHVVGMDDLRSLKETTGRPKDLDDIEKLDEIARAMLQGDDDGG
jgi:predicted nucleotidyltransferase